MSEHLCQRSRYSLACNHKYKVELTITSENPQENKYRATVVNVFSTIPDEIVVHVFSFLKDDDDDNDDDNDNDDDYFPTLGLRPAALVCRRFHRLCLDPSLWRRLKLPPWCHGMSHMSRLDFNAAVRLVERCTQLEKIHLGYRPYSNDLLCKALQQCPLTLTDISIQIRESVNVQDFARVFERFGSAVRSVKLWGKRIGEVSYTAILTRYAACFKNLTTLRILQSENNQFVNDFFRAIGDNCRSLKICDLVALHGVRDDGLDALIEGLKDSLEELYVDAGRCSAEPVRNISKCSELDVLEICWPYPINAAAGRCSSSDALSAILGMPELCGLCISEMNVPGVLTNDDFLVSFGGLKRQLSLEHLELSGTAMGDSGLEAIVDRCGQELRSLDINSEETSVTCAGGLQTLLSTCEKLYELDLGRLADLAPSSSIFVEAFRNAKAPLLRLSVMEEQMSAISEEDLRAIRMLMPKLVNYCGVRME